MNIFEFILRRLKFVACLLKFLFKLLLGGSGCYVAFEESLEGIEYRTVKIFKQILAIEFGIKKFAYQFGRSSAGWSLCGESCGLLICLVSKFFFCIFLTVRDN